jgi:hypothetical protein
MLLLQWVYDAEAHERERAELLAGMLKDADSFDSAFNGVPQLFAILDEPNPSVRAQVSDLVTGAHIGYCMTKKISSVPAGLD